MASGSGFSGGGAPDSKTLALAPSQKNVVSRKGQAALNLADIGEDAKDLGLNFQELVKLSVIGINGPVIMGLGTDQDVGLAEERHVYVANCADWGPDFSETRLTASAAGFSLISETAQQLLFNPTKPAWASRAELLFITYPNLAEELHIMDKAVRQPILRQPNPPAAPSLQLTVDQYCSNADYKTAYDALVANLHSGARTEALDGALQALTQALIAEHKKSFPDCVFCVFLGGNAWFTNIPHGSPWNGASPVDKDAMMAEALLVNFVLNRRELAARYPSDPKAPGWVRPGLITSAALSIAQSAVYGLFEAVSGREYKVIDVTRNASCEYTINTALPSTAAGSKLDVKAVAVNSTMLTHANGANFLSGLVHYTRNHTTGGTIMDGQLLAHYLIAGLIATNDSLSSGTEKAGTGGEFPSRLLDATSVVYNALHPVGKRLLACTVLDQTKTKIAYFGRPLAFPTFPHFSLDAWAKFRAAPFPSGAHKAYLFLMGLKKVARAKLAVFLPWYDQIAAVMAEAKALLTAGARAHVGAKYYTGDPGLAQGASFDQYLPELAAYITTMTPGDTLAYSPHLGAIRAAAADGTWTTLLRSLKGRGAQGGDVDKVNAYLVSTGAASAKTALKLDDVNTYAAAGAEAADLARQIADLGV